MDHRYSRQELFAEIGPQGQRRIEGGSVLLVGCGALGSLAAELLVRAGLGRLRLVDRDFVEDSNLQRQVLFDERDAREAMPKAAAAEARLRQINSAVVVEGIVTDVSAGNVAALASGCDLILDGTDNFEIRYLINDLSVKTAVPWIYAAAVGSHGLTMNVLPGVTSCLRCLFESAPPPGTSPTCDTAGVIGPLVGVIASIQTAEALKFLAGHPEKMSRDLVSVDVWEGRFDRLRADRPVPGCPACGERRFDWLEGEAASSTTTLCGRRSVQVLPAGRARVDLETLAGRLAPLGDVTVNRFLIRVRVEGHELTVFADGRAIVGETTDPSVARALYARYVGL